MDIQHGLNHAAGRAQRSQFWPAVHGAVVGHCRLGTPATFGAPPRQPLDLPRQQFNFVCLRFLHFRTTVPLVQTKQRRATNTPRLFFNPASQRSACWTPLLYCVFMGFNIGSYIGRRHGCFLLVQPGFFDISVTSLVLLLDVVLARSPYPVPVRVSWFNRSSPIPAAISLPVRRQT